jgi:fatty acyl-CoA reductase
MYERADRAFAALQFFTTHQWRFISNNPILLMEKMSAHDRDTFYFDVRDINWERYFETYILGARRFILKDDPSTLSVARSNLNR